MFEDTIISLESFD